MQMDNSATQPWKNVIFQNIYNFPQNFEEHTKISSFK